MCNILTIIVSRLISMWGEVSIPQQMTSNRRDLEWYMTCYCSLFIFLKVLVREHYSIISYRNIR